jgi:hypothetical protein
MHTRLTRLLVLGGTCFVMASSVVTARDPRDPADLYFDGFLYWKDAESLITQGRKSAAREKLEKAEAQIAYVQETFPSWHPDVVKHRLLAIRKRLAELVPPDLTPVPPLPLTPPKPAPPTLPHIPTIKPDPQYLQRPSVPFIFNGQLYYKMLLNAPGEAPTPTPLRR